MPNEETLTWSTCIYTHRETYVIKYTHRERGLNISAHDPLSYVVLWASIK